MFSRSGKKGKWHRDVSLTDGAVVVCSWFPCLVQVEPEADWQEVLGAILDQLNTHDARTAWVFLIAVPAPPKGPLKATP